MKGGYDMVFIQLFAVHMWNVHVCFSEYHIFYTGAKDEWGAHWGWVRKGCWGDDYLQDFYSMSDLIRMIKSQVWMHTKYDSQNLRRRKQVTYLSWLLTLECNFEIGSGFAGVGQTIRCVLPVTVVHCILVTW